jgi:hypothetical protein
MLSQLGDNHHRPDGGHFAGLTGFLRSLHAAKK